MPAASTTARTAPPAMTPVPARRASAARWRREDRRTSCGIVVPTIGILMRFFLASSTPLRMASGTSPALPSPAPTWPGAVADDDDRAEAEAAAALDDLRDAVDLDDALLERELVGIDPCHVGSFRSEIQAGFAGRFGERLDPPVVPEPGPIEDHPLDAGGSSPARRRAADGGRLLGLRRLGPRSPSRASRPRPASGPDASSMTWA